MPIYVEILIRGSMDDLWTRTQDPALHERWDLRFTRIEYLPRPDEAQPQRFRYATRIGFGLSIEGEGESTGTRDEPSGERTSALRFWSDDPKSLIREGSGYWKYVPATDGTRFLTAYDYTTRFGALGRAIDSIAFRALLGWATAWSFDALRLWIEDGAEPRLSRQRSLTHAVARIMIAFVFLYHGLVPKLLFFSSDEGAILIDAGVPEQVNRAAAAAIGCAEVLWSILVVWLWRSRWPLAVTAALMVAALGVVAVASPRFLSAAFNPVTLNLAVIALAALAWWSCSNLPSAKRCLRSPGGAAPRSGTRGIVARTPRA